MDFKGAWAWFRLVDSAQARPGDSSEKTMLTLQTGSHATEIIVDAGSVHNPFGTRAWQKFSCGD